MFTLQQSDEDELVFQILSNPCQQGKISQDLIVDYASLETSTIDHLLNTSTKNSRKKRKPRKVVLGRNTNSDKNDEITAAADDEIKLKKIMHRDMERERRRGMATLFSSLRSLLPLPYVKGKRSVSDHMHEAVNYIKQLQANINELERRRDELKMEVPNNSSPHGGKENGGGSSDSTSVMISPECVRVNPCQGGVEILIYATYRGESALPLSRVLHELMQKGLDVVSCVSSQLNQNSLHRIQSQASDMKCINLHALQRKVIDVINIDL